MAQELASGAADALLGQVADLGLSELAGGLAGVVFEIIPALQKHYSGAHRFKVWEKLHAFVGTRWKEQLAGSAIWVLYKRTPFGQHKIDVFVESLLSQDTAALREAVVQYSKEFE